LNLRMQRSFTVLHRHDPYGSNFKLLGAIYDTSLSMQPTFDAIKKNMQWRLRALYKLRKFFTEAKMINLFKTKIWSSVEWCTPCIYHGTKSQLDIIDRAQRRFLRFMGLSEVEAFEKYKLAPLSLRRSIAMLGFIFRCVRGNAPERCCSLFNLSFRIHNYNTRRQKALHSAQLVDPVGPKSGAVFRRSVYGLIAFWNALPPDVVAVDNVKIFQGMIQDAALDAIKSGASISDVCALKFIHRRYGDS